VEDNEAMQSLQEAIEKLQASSDDNQATLSALKDSINIKLTDILSEMKSQQQSKDEDSIAP
jgi:hypothetical protein